MISAVPAKVQRYFGLTTLAVGRKPFQKLPLNVSPAIALSSSHQIKEPMWLFSELPSRSIKTTHLEIEEIGTMFVHGPGGLTLSQIQ